MSVYGKLLDPDRCKRVPLGVKGERKYHTITHNPSTVNEGQTLYVRLPKLAKDLVIVPGTLKLTFDLAPVGHTNNRFVNDVGRVIQAHVIDKLGGEIISDVNNYNIYKTYCDLWLTLKEQNNLAL